MRYWYAPLRPEPGNLFMTPDAVNARKDDPLYIGEIKQEVYERMMHARVMGSENVDEFGLPTTTTDEFGL